jgi:N-acetylglucosamine kinase-like BadF-type ATPase
VTPIHLGIDVGGTASRWVACDDTGGVIARGKANGATGHLFNAIERDRLQKALSAIAAELSAQGLVAGFVTVGLTAYGIAVFEQMTQLLVDTFGVAASNTIVVDDMTLAYAAIFAPGEGHLVSAGTGSIGLHIGEDGKIVRVGGRGILIDDAGSGSWIALRALDQVYRCLDHTGSFSDVAVLAQQLFAVIGGDDWHGVRQFVYGGDRGIIGSLAVAVGKAAEQGDKSALAILRDAGSELALMGKALIGRAGKRPVGFIGGVLSVHPVIGEEIQRSLSGYDVRLVQADTALAAAQLNAGEAGRWKQILTTKLA